MGGLPGSRGTAGAGAHWRPGTRCSDRVRPAHGRIQGVRASGPWAQVPRGGLSATTNGSQASASSPRSPSWSRRRCRQRPHGTQTRIPRPGRQVAPIASLVRNAGSFLSSANVGLGCRRSRALVIRPLINSHRGHGDRLIAGVAMPAQVLMAHVRGLHPSLWLPLSSITSTPPPGDGRRICRKGESHSPELGAIPRAIPRETVLS